MYFNPIVSREGVQKLRSSCLEVASTIRSIFGKEKLSFGQALFRSVKSTHLFRGDDDVGQPVWVMEFFNDTDFDKFGHLFFYDLQMFWSKISSFLVD